MRELVVVCLLAGCGYHAPGGTDPANPDGTVPIGHAKKLVFDNSASATDLVGFQVMVGLDATVLDYAQITDPTTDLRFDDAEAADLPFDVERWDPTGKSIVWVRVPTIDARSKVDSIELHFGSDVAGHADPHAVWAGYEVVEHLGDHLENSAASSYAGTPHGAIDDPQGQIGSATKFTPTTDLVALANGNTLLDGWQSFTFASWIRLDYPSANLSGAEPSVFSKGASANNPRIFQSGAQLHYQIDWEFTTGTVFRGTDVPLQTWTDVVWTFDGQTLRVYRDGTLADSQTLAQTDRLITDAGAFGLGNNGNAFAGAFDEVRLAKTALTDDTIRAQHLSMTSAFVTFTDP